ncbi:MAG: cation transporter [Candidatus Nitrohelix vancouverensis]|uniref:Cation transporter n=1 Tax=Candidatus Nitrohelix vancouverensis TaxID=2705534 RepID=A0A7T0G4H2_9BACT|nr:MAG: cation transporter [Candidatus Nitrohelix vancouverensis]
MNTSALVQNRLLWALLVTSFILVLEVVGGLIANSLALLGDAAHMASDMFALGLSWLALKWAHRPSPTDKTFGYHRAEIFAALINGLLLIFLAANILIEAWERMQNPADVDSATVVLVAAVGLAANLCVIFILKNPMHHSHDLNLRSAYLHVLGDTAASLGVIIGAAVIYFTGWTVIDPVIGGLIALLLIWNARKVVSDAFHILMEGAPKNLSVKEVAEELKSLPGVLDVHEMYIWSICSNVNALSAHALVHDQQLTQAERVLADIQTALKNKFNITHSTIQFESAPCKFSGSLQQIQH